MSTELGSVKLAYSLDGIGALPVVKLSRSEAMRRAMANGVPLKDAGELADVAKTLDVLIGSTWVRVIEGVG